MISGRIKSFILGILLGYLSLSAHPHIFIDGSLNFVTNGKNISGLHLIWTWDENWSNDIINDCNTDGDGIFNKEETALVYEDYMSDIKEFNYFTEIYINGKKQVFKAPAKFTAAMNKDYIVTFDFILPFTATPGKTAAVKILFNDKSTYTAFEEKQKLLKAPGFRYEKTVISPYKDYGVHVAFNLIAE